MRILEKYRFLKNRFSQIPRKVFSNAKNMALTLGELDLVFKLLNFTHFEEVKPNLSNIATQSGISLRTYQRSISDLKNKGLLSVEQTKDECGKFSTNSYSLSKFFTELTSGSFTQLSLDFDSFGAKSSILGGFIMSPKALDFFQKDLDLSQKESVFLKYLFCYIDDSGVSEIGLNYLTKISPLSRTILTSVVKSLSDKKLIIIKEQFIGRGKIKTRNRYDLNPLLEKLNELERKKSENKLKEQGVWKDYSKKRVRGEIKEPEQPVEETRPVNKGERIEFLENEITRLQSQFFSKNSAEADQIREYQQELNLMKYNPISKNLISNLLLERFNHIKKSQKKKSWNSKYTKDEYQIALNTCKKLNGNWSKNSNFYLKAVSLCKTTLDRYIALTENAKKKERYFLVSVSKVFKKIEQSKEDIIPNFE